MNTIHLLFSNKYLSQSRFYKLESDSLIIDFESNEETMTQIIPKQLKRDKSLEEQDCTEKTFKLKNQDSMNFEVNLNQR